LLCVWVIGYSLVPLPPARIMPFIFFYYSGETIGNPAFCALRFEYLLIIINWFGLYFRGERNLAPRVVS
jgi:hypothetical protein